MRHKLPVLISIITCNFICIGESILCYDCKSDQGTCNDGECDGIVCVKMETSTRYSDRRTVQKGCSEEIEENGCQESNFGTKWISRCVCHRSWCNGDDQLEESGYEPSSGTIKIPFPKSQLALFMFISIFLFVSCILVVFNSVCIQIYS